MYKKCPRCSKTKLSSEFFQDRGKKDGLRSYCKTCSSISDKLNYIKRCKKIEVSNIPISESDEAIRQFWMVNRSMKKKNAYNR